jgi:hypothetical protein
VADSIGKKIGKAYSDLPAAAKGIIAVTVVVVTIVAIRKVIKAIDERKRAEEERETASEHGEEIVDLGKQGIKPSLSDAQLQTMAAQLYKAMDGCGTDEDSIISIMGRVNNDADIKTIIKMFGTKSVSCGWSGDKFSLPSALRSELSEYYISKINRMFELKGMKTRF